jgi:RNA polymerase primary sigma factor
MVAEHAEVRSKAARETPVPAKNAIHHRERGSPRGPEAQEFPSVEHLQKFSGSKDRPPSDPLQGPAARMDVLLFFPTQRTTEFFSLMARAAAGCCSWEKTAMNRHTQADRRALARLCQHDLLSFDEERRLFGRLKVLKAQALRHRRATGAKAALKEAIAIRNRIVESNLRLVVVLARHFTAPERSLEELVSEAALPLIRCVESFDSRRGTRFSTYATRALTNFFARLRRQDYRRRSRFRLGDDWQYVVWRESDSTTSDRLIEAEDLRNVARRLARLSCREQALVSDRFGLTGDRSPLTFRELGARHGLSKERVRVITSEAIARLRESLDESLPP